MIKMETPGVFDLTLKSAAAAILISNFIREFSLTSQNCASEGYTLWEQFFVNFSINLGNIFLKVYLKFKEKGPLLVKFFLRFGEDFTYN